jgi:DNA-binding NarL/FixJ family response regulator
MAAGARGYVLKDAPADEVLTAIASGDANKQIARRLDLSVRTVETHRLSIKRRLGIGGQVEVIRFAVLQTRSDNTLK